MALNDGDKAIVREIAFEASKVVAEELGKAMATKLRLHSLSCPAVKTVERWRMMLIGGILGGAIIGSGSAVGLLELFKILK